MMVAQHGSKPHFYRIVASITRDINLVNAFAAVTIPEVTKDF
jgi:hypothetical protein